MDSHLKLNVPINFGIEHLSNAYIVTK
ncbi:uncharacterized protein METZ01_LOCUS186308 [marine metagenome]|uniref:Uncharacterized protein n=1 Tax=marine metagenome TaxID=408172 RepID=A0A382D5Z3_9ZZZZ